MSETNTAAAPRGYFQDPLPANLILLTFFFITLPLTAFIWNHPSHLLLWLYIWLFGMTHFVLTFTIYFNRKNLVHFNRSWKNRLIYFIAPCAIFVLFDLFHALQLGSSAPTFALTFFAAIRLLDFNHLNRQSFGVLQLFKAQQELSYAKNLKRLEISYFNLLTAFMFLTFLAGGVSPFLQQGGPLTIGNLEVELISGRTISLGILQGIGLALGLAIVCMLGYLICGYRQARRSGVDLGADKPTLYLLFQTASAMLGAISLWFYAAALAIHYVEYHLLMYPRCFYLKMDETSRIDRTFMWMRRTPMRFYSIVLGVAALATLFAYHGMGMMGMTMYDPEKPFTLLALLALFDGLFVFHYLVETYIWRFGEPHYRETLSALYFAPKPKPAPSVLPVSP